MEKEATRTNTQVKRCWQTPKMDVLEVQHTLSGGGGIWHYVWDGEFWKLELLTS